MPDVPILVCVQGALSGSRIEVPNGGLDIGRSEDNHIVITDDGVSRFHARLLYDSGQLWLQDSGSRNGSFVNGTRVTDHRSLKVGDEITIAKHTFNVQWLDEDDALTADVSTDVNAADGKKESEGTKSWWWPFS